MTCVHFDAVPECFANLEARWRTSVRRRFNDGRRRRINLQYLTAGWLSLGSTITSIAERSFFL